MSLPDGPLIAWYGDDFTGAAAVMEVLSFAGLRSALFLEPPSAARLARFGDLRGIGLAGASRTMTPAEMDRELPQAFAALRATGAPILHYKVCSTLDSAPSVGSIGRAAEIGLEGRDAAVPLLVAAPAISRWQVFGNLFALAGGRAVRLDRHPTMAVHPATPMDEADVRLHIARQTTLGVGLVDLCALKAGRGAEALATERARGATIIALDTVDDESLRAAGEVIRGACEAGGFVIGSQGVEYALVAAWRAAGLIPEPPRPHRARPVDRIAVVSGSCSPVTDGQIAAAETDGFEVVAFDAARVVDARERQAEAERAVSAALAVLAAGRSPIVATARGPADPGVARFAAMAAQAPDLNDRLGRTLGEVLGRLVRDEGLARVAIAGGDTSSRGTEALGLWALTAESPVAPGVPLLRGWSDDPSRDGIEIALKGGQMGPPDLFSHLRAASPGGWT